MKSAVELDGGVYDNRTGQLISKRAPNKATKPIAVNKGTILDGVTRRRPRPSVAVTKKEAQTPTKQNKKPVTVPFTRPEKAKTLFRNAVSKPSGLLSSRKQPKNANNSSNSRKNTLFNRVDVKKQQKALNTNKNHQIKRYGEIKSPTPVTTKKPKADITRSSQKQFLPIPPLVTKKNLKANLSRKEAFERRIATATNHLARPLANQKWYEKIAFRLNIQPKHLTAITVCLVVTVIVGFIAYHEVPSIAMRFATSKAGFHGRLPGNIPSGFSFKKPIQSSRGVIVINYKSNSDNRFFTLIQKPTNWSSEALLTNFFVASKTQYQAYHDRGLTVYIYNEGDATWVNKGVWYTLGGRGLLSSDQILAIASSM